MAYQNCFICKGEVESFDPGETGTIVNCKVCKPYVIHEKPLRGLLQGDLANRHLVSGAIRELNERGLKVIINNLESLLDSVVVPDGPLERIDRIVLHIFRQMETYDSKLRLLDHDYSIAYARSISEFRFLIDRASELRYLDRHRNGDIDDCQLTIEGWRHVAKLKQDERKTNQAFIAMSFDPAMQPIYFDGIKPAITETGYVPLRVDEAEYNDKIDDRIIADIRKSGLVIADFTQHKAGVYFEAGFALGLGIPVIWICRDTDIETAHFDTRQYNHIVWTNAQDLKEKLVARIEATVPLRNERSNVQS